MGWQDAPVIDAGSSGGWQSAPIVGDAPVINFDRPIEQVRADIAKLPASQREEALNEWGNHYVAKENKTGGDQSTIGKVLDFLYDMGNPMPNSRQIGNDVVRTVSKGTFIGPYLDELTAATGGAPYDETLAYQRAKDRALEAAAPASTTGLKVAGGVAGGIGALKARGAAQTAGALAVGGPLAQWSPASTLPRQIAQGAATGAVYGQAAGFGEGEGGLDQRLENATNSAGVGMGVGAVLPPVVAGAGKALTVLGEAASPQMARLAARWQRPGETRVGMAAGPIDGDGAAGAAGGASAGADAAAEQTIANQLMRANVPASRLRQQLDDAAESARFYSGSHAQNAMAPVDLDPSLQRLAGSVSRQQPEAANTAQAFQSARQTGITPDAMNSGQVAELFGLPVRPPLAPPVTGAQATRTLGTNFKTAQDSFVPMGQQERVRDALKRALVIVDSDFHGHAANAHRTESGILNAAKVEARTLYNDFYKAGEGIDLAPAVTPVLQKWTQQLVDEPVQVSAALDSAMRQVQRAVVAAGNKTHAERLDKVKQVIDDRIDKALTSANGRQRYLGGKLIEFKDDLVSSIDRVPGLGEKYKAARDMFSSRMEARDMLKLGRDVFRDDADIGVDQIAAVTAPGMVKLLRLGILDGAEKLMMRQKRTADVTQMFENPRVQEILRAVIPRTETAGGKAVSNSVFGNRPERFGQFVANEKTMVNTRNVTLGGSSTQRNIQDDKATDSLMSIVDQIKQQPSIVGLGMKAVEKVLDSLFGFRADTAASIARQLFTASPAERLKVIARIEARMGPTRAAQFAELMQQFQRQITQAGSIAGAAQSQP